MLELGDDIDDRAEAASFARYTHRYSHRPRSERVEFGDLGARLDRPRRAAARRPDGALDTGVSRAARSPRGASDSEARGARASRSIVLLKRAEALSRRRAVARALLGVAAPSITAPVVSCRPRRVQWLPPRERRRVRPFHSWTAVWARERGPGEARVAGFDEEVRRIHGTGAPCAVRRRRRT